jgi:hypothetical protein
MFEFLGRGRAKSDRSPTDPGPSTLPLWESQSATQREVVRFALQNVLKRNGIPSQWLAGEVVPVHIPGQGEALILQLEILHWNDALVLHGPALQNELLDEVQRFDPAADRARYLFTWKFSASCNCPHTHLPEPAFWAPFAAASAQAQAASVAPATQPAKPATASAPHHIDIDADDDDDQGFAPTQIRDGG